MPGGSGTAIAMSLTAAAVMGLAGGCAQRAAAPEPQQPQFRASAETAPADLQLVCAEEAAAVYDLATARTLPLASSVEEDGTYTVVLNAAGTRAICTIDDEGNVLSLETA